MSGDRTAGAITFSTSVEPWIASVPPATRPAPTKPPISAWLEEDAPAKFRSAHSPTATRGRSARVAIEVAIAFAVS
jgi:hypothetical protein